jgi:hypothetical protein
MDATHLAEFFQVEGVVADYDITLGNLVGMWSFLLNLSGPLLNPLRGSQLISSVHGGVLCKDGEQEIEVQTCFQPLYRGESTDHPVSVGGADELAKYGDFLVS